MRFTIVVNNSKNNESETRQKRNSGEKQDEAACRLSATGCWFLGVRLVTSCLDCGEGCAIKEWH